jgi:phosphoglycerate dehydrogenase-like enzyme
MLTIGIFNEELHQSLCQLLEDLIRDAGLKLMHLSTETKQDSELVEGLVTYRLSREEAKLYPNLKYVFAPLTGLERFDLEYINNHQIQLFNAHAKAKYIAERGFTITMGLLGNLRQQDGALREGQWLRVGEEGMWKTLFNRKVGIYGYGHIGQAYHKMLMPFTEQVYTINRGKKYPEQIKLVKDLKALAEVSEVLFISVPLSEKTEGSINDEIIGLMENGYLVNVGRGKLVDAKALEKALQTKSISGYGADVWYNYPKEGNGYMIPTPFEIKGEYPLLMTPHNGWNIDKDKDIIQHEMAGYIRKVCDRH